MRIGEMVLGHSNPPRTKIEETVLDLTQTAVTFDDVCGWVTRAFVRDLTDEATLRKAKGPGKAVHRTVDSRCGGSADARPHPPSPD